MRNLFVSISVIFVSGCVPDMTPDKNILKSLKMNDAVIEWFNRSAAYAETPDFITVTRGDHIDTLCAASNIADIKKDEGRAVITLCFYGVPKNHGHAISLPTKVLDFTILADTTYIRTKTAH